MRSLLTAIPFNKPSTWVGILSLVGGCYAAYGIIAGFVRIIFGDSEMSDYLFFSFTSLLMIIFVVPAIYCGFGLIREKSLSNVKGAVACTTVILVLLTGKWTDQFFPEHNGTFLSMLCGTVVYVVGVRVLACVEPIHLRYFIHEEPIKDVPVRDLIRKAWVGLMAFTLFGVMSDLIRNLQKNALNEDHDFWYGWSIIVPIATAFVFYQIIVRTLKLPSETEPVKIPRRSKPVDEAGPISG